jgi:hypothetical protein
MSKLQLEKVTTSENHKKILFNLLQQRAFSISRDHNILFSDHSKFVDNHPYRAWFLIKYDDEAIGSAYVVKDNSIGIDLAKNKLMHVEKTLELLMDKFKPLKGKNSIRNKSFFINANYKNKPLMQVLESLNYIPLQISYQIKK